MALDIFTCICIWRYTYSNKSFTKSWSFGKTKAMPWIIARPIESLSMQHTAFEKQIRITILCVCAVITYPAIYSRTKRKLIKLLISVSFTTCHVQRLGQKICDCQFGQCKIRHWYYTWIGRQTSNISRTKYPNWNVSPLVLKLFSPNPLMPDVKSRMRM